MALSNLNSNNRDRRSLDEVVYDCLREDLRREKQRHVDVLFSFYSEASAKVEHAADCHRIALASKSKLLRRLLNAHDGPDEDKLRLVLVGGSIGAGEAEALIELMYDPEKTGRDIALWDDDEGGVVEAEQMDYVLEPETILQADAIKREPLEEGGTNDESSMRYYEPISNCKFRPVKLKTLKSVLEEMNLNEIDALRVVGDSKDRIFCRLCETTLTIGHLGDIKDHCNSARHKMHKERADPGKLLQHTDIKREDAEEPSCDPLASANNISWKSFSSHNYNPKQSTYVPKKVKTLEEVLVEVNILENFALRVVENSKDKIYCQICEKTLTINQLSDITKHCKTAQHRKKKEHVNVPESNKQLYDQIMTQLVRGPKGKRATKVKTLQEVLQELNVHEKGALKAVENAKDKVFCQICNTTLTIGCLSDMKKHCNTPKHLNGKNLMPSPSSGREEVLCSDVTSDGEKLYEKSAKHLVKKQKGQDESGEGTNVCPYCQHGFALVAPCKQHIFKVHGVEVPKGMGIKKFSQSIAESVKVTKKSSKWKRPRSKIPLS